MSCPKAHIRCCSSLNPWIDSIFSVSPVHVDAAILAIRAGIRYFNANSHMCYSDSIRNALHAADIPFADQYCEYDEETDEVTEEWYRKLDGMSIHTTVYF